MIDGATQMHTHVCMHEQSAHKEKIGKGLYNITARKDTVVLKGRRSKRPKWEGWSRGECGHKPGHKHRGGRTVNICLAVHSFPKLSYFICVTHLTSFSPHLSLQVCVALPWHLVHFLGLNSHFRLYLRCFINGKKHQICTSLSLSVILCLNMRLFVSLSNVSLPLF